MWREAYPSFTHCGDDLGRAQSIPELMGRALAMVEGQNPGALHRESRRQHLVAARQQSLEEMLGQRGQPARDRRRSNVEQQAQALLEAGDPDQRACALLIAWRTFDQGTLVVECRVILP